MAKSVPITISIQEDDLNKLKGIASYHTTQSKSGEVVTYGDMIREFVRHGMGKWIEFGINPEPDDPDLAFINPNRMFWTERQIEQFNETPRGKMIAECIETGKWEPYVAMFNRSLNTWFQSRSLATKLMVWSEAQKTRLRELSRVVRDPATIAYVIARRGAIPECIQEAEEIVTPSFTLAGSCRVRRDEQLPWFLSQLVGKAACAYQKEVDSNILNCFIAAADSRGYQVLYEEGNGFTTQNLKAAIREIVRHDLIPAHVLVNPTDYTDLHEFGTDFLKCPPLKEALETGNYGSIMGVPITLSSRLREGTVVVAAGPEHVGVFTQDNPPTVRHEPMYAKDADQFVYSGTIRLLICNDYAISVVNKNNNTTAKLEGLSVKSDQKPSEDRWKCKTLEEATLGAVRTQMPIDNAKG